MTKLAIIGGTGLSEFPGLKITKQLRFSSKFGKPSSDLYFASYQNKEIIFLARHGEKHSIAPHKINYRANIDVLKQAGVTDIIAVNAVGGIDKNCSPDEIVIPDQIIDYTHSRINTFLEDDGDRVTHIDFSFPYDKNLCQKMFTALQETHINYVKTGTYGATQGPRLETGAEIKRLKQDGCDIVGMTGMPEAALARELDINYASCCVVVNWSSGITNEVITMADIEKSLDIGMANVKKMLIHVLEN
jgi:5'-deoxy-5'-methylthioadenosine phosphorylase